MNNQSPKLQGEAWKKKLVYINSRTLFPWPPGKRVIFWNMVHPFLRIFVDAF